ncbi:hypothetical protein EYZ11_008852 [Aspergillus tanneri]|uniref:Uncharacterized protein n=1 Tax=Aspergillus tanneri TaxID=1220188 RepID=A0A4S3JEX1_9EURO|nr:uncharacterized protein ATNIH1004_010316 [Aspergillus tanneri]KAA8643547.1 hypothetical protein ATNIH1004_010316 [Aspergillus tanneri]THC91681.1 hypothetical protein EYZ11_008852 [Aspergillus tanneri]
MPLESRRPSLASILVARFLRTNNYTQTLEAFIREAGLPTDAGHISGEKDDWTIERVLDEKRAFDQSANFERYGDSEKENDAWSSPGEHNNVVLHSAVTDQARPAPSKPTIIPTPTPCNILACSVHPWKHGDAQNSPSSLSSYIVATGADKQLHLFSTAPGYGVVQSFTDHSESPILSYTPILNGEYALLTNMSGQILLQHGLDILDRRRDHSKYVVKVAAFEDNDDPHPDPAKTIWIATAGWDSKVFLYRLRTEADSHHLLNIGEPVGHITLASNPESLLFVRHVDSKEPILLVSRRDSPHLFYYQLPQSITTTTITTISSAPEECRLLGKQNFAPHSNTWVAFSPSCLALSPHDPGLLAVATSTLPHMKVIIVRLLFPPTESFNLDTSGPVTTGSSEPEVQATQALAALALQNREDAAIIIQANTFAPQTAYSTPQVVWRPDGSGVWVNGDDGIIRGIETKTGKVVSMLKDGHEPGCKVRAIWDGWVDVPRDGEVVREEWLVSGGFDKRLVVWKGV